MCRSIKVLRGQAPTDDDVSKAALQFVRKVSGFQKPSKANHAAFERAIAEVAAATQRLLDQVEKGAATTRVPGSAVDESTACD